MVARVMLKAEYQIPHRLVVGCDSCSLGMEMVTMLVVMAFDGNPHYCVRFFRDG